MLKSLHESEDAYIVRILKSEQNHILAEVASGLNPDHASLFNGGAKNIIWDARSTLARDGTNVKSIGEIALENGRIVTTVSIYNFIPEFMPAGCAIHDFFGVGTRVGKFYFVNPDKVVKSDKLEEYLDRRHIITGRGWKILSDGKLRLPLEKIIFCPNEFYNADIKRMIVDGDLSRSRLTAYQAMQSVEGLEIGKDGGLITYAALWTSGLEVFVLSEHHSEAKIGSQYTKGRFYAEFEGNRLANIPIGGLEVLLFYPERREIKFYVPVSLSAGKGTKLEDNPTLLEAKKALNTSQNNGIGMGYADLSNGNLAVRKSVSRKDTREQIEFVKSFERLNDIYLFFNEFPLSTGIENKGGISDRLQSLSKEGRLKSLYLLNAPKGIYFSDESVKDLNILWENGTQILWYNPILKRWMFYHSEFWVKPERLAEFIDYYNSGKMCAFYGSSKRISEGLSSIVDDAIESVLKFHGGQVAILTGGMGNSGSLMHYVTTAARRKGALVGASVWNCLGQIPNDDYDFVQYYDDRDLSPRQEQLQRKVECGLYWSEWGLGTAYEWFLDLTNKKIGVGEKTPLIMLGDDGWSDMLKAVKKQEAKGLVPKHAMSGVYVVENGAQVYGTLCRHFGTMP